jgi:hypothetical protein
VHIYIRHDIIRKRDNEIIEEIIMQQIFTPLLHEVSSLPPAMQVIVVSALGMLGVWMAMRHIDKNAGYY